LQFSHFPLNILRAIIKPVCSKNSDIQSLIKRGIRFRCLLLFSQYATAYLNVGKLCRYLYSDIAFNLRAKKKLLKTLQEKKKKNFALNFYSLFLHFIVSDFYFLVRYVKRMHDSQLWRVPLRNTLRLRWSTSSCVVRIVHTYVLSTNQSAAWFSKWFYFTLM